MTAVGLSAVVACGATDDDDQLADRQAEVAERGAEVMPFDLDATTHRFEPSDTGLIETVVADDPSDTNQVDLIRDHLAQEADRFERGDYGDPATIHGQDMAGLAELETGAESVTITIDELPDGARLTFTTNDPDLVDALHRWAEAQTTDHGPTPPTPIPDRPDHLRHRSSAQLVWVRRRSRGLASSLVAGEAAQSYELTRNPRPFANALVGASAIVTGAGSLARDGRIAVPVIFIGVGVLMAANAAQIIMRWPTRITVRDDGMVFKAMTYDRLVPWADVESVRVHRGRYGGSIRWTLAQRPHVTTAATFENLHHLLVEVEHRAPQAMVSL